MNLYSTDFIIFNEPCISSFDNPLEPKSSNLQIVLAPPCTVCNLVIAFFMSSLRSQPPYCACHLLVDVVLMERSASSYSSKSQTHVMCLCNVEVPLMPSWTKENPGRNFYGCGLYRARNNVYYWFCFGLCVDFCVYFAYVDYK